MPDQSANLDQLPRVHVISLGGTIAMTASADAGVSPTLDATDLTTAVPELGDVAQISTESLLRIPGASLTLENIVTLARAVDARPGVEGVVVTQGTDTLEDTSFVLELLGTDLPVVFTGAMRHPGSPSADGAANLLAAVRVAIDAGAKQYRTLVVMNDQIHSPRRVTKAHTTRLDAFQSPGTGPVGGLAETNVRWATPPERPITIGMVDVPLPRVTLIPVGLGDDAALLSAALATAPAGLVVAAMGGGHVPEVLAEPLKQASSVVPVVLCSRTGSGAVLRNTYGFKGSEIDLLGGGLIWGGALPARKARLYTTIALAAGWSRQQLAGGLAEFH